MDLIRYFKQLHQANKQIELLNFVYWLFCGLGLVLSIFSAIFNQSLAVAFLIIPIVAFTAICLNTLVWELIGKFVHSKKAQMQAAKTIDRVDKKVKILNQKATKKIARKSAKKSTKKSTKKSAKKVKKSPQNQNVDMIIYENIIDTYIKQKAAKA